MKQPTSHAAVSPREGVPSRDVSTPPKGGPLSAGVMSLGLAVRDGAVARDLELPPLHLDRREVGALLRWLGIGAVIVTLAGLALALRVSNDRLTKDIRRHEHLADRAAGTWEQLQLDVAARRAPEHLEAAALAMGLQPATKVERIGAQP